MSIGLFIDGSYAYNVYPGALDFTKFRSAIETHLSEAVSHATELAVQRD